jgi:hypothetical protein
MEVMEAAGDFELVEIVESVEVGDAASVRCVVAAVAEARATGRVLAGLRGTFPECEKVRCLWLALSREQLPGLLRGKLSSLRRPGEPAPVLPTPPTRSSST